MKTTNVACSTFWWGKKQLNDKSQPFSVSIRNAQSFRSKVKHPVLGVFFFPNTTKKTMFLIRKSTELFRQQ